MHIPLFIALAMSYARSVHGTEVRIALSNEEITFGESIVINVSVVIGDETAEKPALEIHLPPKLYFIKASVNSTVCESPNPCMNESLTLKAEDGELMGKFSLGDRIIKGTRSFVVTGGKSRDWPAGFTYRSIIRLENVSAVNVDENPQFAIGVFRYWKPTSISHKDIPAVESQWSVGKYFRLHPVKVTVQAVSDQGAILNGISYRISSQNSIHIKLTAKIDPRAGNVVLKLTAPNYLLVDKSGYTLGNNKTDTAVMQIKNQTTNTIDLYVLVTPSMLAAAGDNTAVLHIWLRARENQLTTEGHVCGAVLYGYDFQNHADAPPINLSIAATPSSFLRESTGPKLTPPRTVIEYAPQPRPDQLLDEEHQRLVNFSTVLDPDMGITAANTNGTTGSVTMTTGREAINKGAMQADPTGVMANFSMDTNWTDLVFTAAPALLKIAEASSGNGNASDLLTLQPSADTVQTFEMTSPDSMVDETTFVQDWTASNSRSADSESVTSLPAVIAISNRSTIPESDVATTKSQENTTIKTETLIHLSYESATSTSATVNHEQETNGQGRRPSEMQLNGTTSTVNTSEIAKTTPSSTGACKDGWWSMNIMLSDCYYFPKMSLPYTEAENEKTNLDATEVWIGLTRSTSMEFWKWTDGSPAGYSDWCPEYPTSPNSKNCAVCSSSTSDNYCWKNRYCDQSLYFFCSRPRDAQ